jgi:hypothetical protein
MSELRKLLAYELDSSDTVKDEAVETMSPQLRKLLQTEGIESTTLIQTEFSKTVLEGAQPKISARAWLPVVRIKSNAFDWPKRPAASYATKVGEGGSSPAAEMDYGKTTFTTYKISRAAEISEELIEDGLYDIITMEVKDAAAACENRLNRDAVGTMMDNAGKEVDTVGNPCSVSYLGQACREVNDAGFEASDAVLSWNAWYDLMTDSNLVYTSYAGTSSTLRTGKVFPIFGLTAHVCGVTASATYGAWTGTWGGDTDGYFMALIHDKSKAGGIALRRDLTTKKFVDVRRDIQGAVVSMRYAVNYLQANAICRIEV